MRFKGDILITDPCYLMKEEEDWSRCEYGSSLDILGFTDFLNSSTGYGDWSCTTFKGRRRDNVTRDDVLGAFCADAGLVCVVLLDDVLKYNPDFNYHTDKPWTTTLIKDFDGDVTFTRDDDGNTVVIGTGNIDFFTAQTGF